MSKQILKHYIFVFGFLFPSYILGQGSTSSMDLPRLSNTVSKQSMRIDSLDAQFRLLLPELQNALSANLKAKEQTDSVAILLINRINTFQNKMRLIEDKISYVDSVNFEILAQLVMVENKIVTLANSFTEMYELKSNKSSDRVSSRISPVEYKRTYIDALTAYQNGDFSKAINGFSGLVISDPTNDLADNSQYWLAECYYTIKNYKRAVVEFEKSFFHFLVQTRMMMHSSNLVTAIEVWVTSKAIEEYQRLIDYFPGSEFYEKARQSIKQLKVQ